MRVAADAVAHRERGRDGAVGIVAVRRRQPEDRHHRVADELLHGAAVRLDALARDRVVASQQAPHLFGIELFTKRGGTGHVGEEHGDDAALLGGDSHGAA